MALSLKQLFSKSAADSRSQLVDDLKVAAVTRTIEGFGALSRIEIKAFSTRGLTTQPERAAYFAAASVNVISSAFGWEKPRRVAKSLLMPLLAANVYRRRHETSKFTTAALLVGLAGGWIGDLVLMPKKPNLNLGAIPFAVNHLAYEVLLWRAGARFNALRTLIRYPLWAGSAGLVALTQPAQLPAATAYGFLLSTTSALADDSSLIDRSEGVTIADSGLPMADASYGLGHGGNLFLISDMLLMLRKMQGEEGWLANVLDAAVMDTYTAAQLLLVEGLLAIDRA